MSEAFALVTGASSGIGRVLARQLAERGRKLLLLARDETRLEETRQAVEAAGGSAEILCCDIGDRAALEAALAGKPLDLVLHAAGVLELGSLEELGEDRVRKLLEVNVLGTTNIVGACLPSLVEHRGRIGILSSIVAMLPVPGGFSAYAASKWALRGWSETVRPELAEKGVSVTVSYPATVDTPMVEGLRESGPGVYRAFGWHDPERVAARLIRDTQRRRRESWAGLVDRSAAFGYRLLPRTFGAAFRFVTGLRSGRREP